MRLFLIVRCALRSLLILCFLFAPQATFAKPDSLRTELDAIADKFHGKIGYSLHYLKTGDRLDRLGDDVRVSYTEKGSDKMAARVDVVHGKN
jgi:hypothetical protein